jgi:hypothetical protein
MQNVNGCHLIKRALEKEIKSFAQRHFYMSIKISSMFQLYMAASDNELGAMRGGK